MMKEGAHNACWEEGKFLGLCISIKTSHSSLKYHDVTCEFLVNVTLLWGSYAQHDASQTELHLPAFTAAPDSLCLAVKQ